MACLQPTNKVIAHVDLDAFYCQVETLRDQDRLAGKPVGVVQYNPYGDLKSLTPEEDRIVNESSNGLIAVNYPARAAGVQRQSRGDEAKKLCPEMQLVQVPTKHGKADLTIYRDAGKRVLDVLSSGGLTVCERASIDECYLDLTAEAQARLSANMGVPPSPPKPHQVHVYTEDGGDTLATDWWARGEADWASGERLLACGAAIVAELRAAVEEQLGYTCSAGIAHTRLLAKLCSGLHKPSQQTVLPSVAVPALLAPLPLGKLRGLGGQFGKQVESDLNLDTVGALAAVPLSRLEAIYGDKDAAWLHALSMGIDDAEVEERKLPKSVSCGKTFRGVFNLEDLAAVHMWLLELAGELEERLAVDKEENKRAPRLLTVSMSNGGQASAARSCTFRRAEAASMAEDATALVKKWTVDQGVGWRITDMFLGASNFVPVQSTNITQFFKKVGGTTGGETNKKSAAGGKEEKEATKEETTTIDLSKETEGGGGGDEAGPSGSNISSRNVTGVIAQAGGSGSGSGGGASAGADAKQSAMAGPSGSSGPLPRVLEVNGEVVDESVFAQLPPEIQAEIRMQIKAEAMALKAAAAGEGKGGGGGSGAKRHTTVTLKEFLKGKRPKK